MAYQVLRPVGARLAPQHGCHQQDGERIDGCGTVDIVTPALSSTLITKSRVSGLEAGYGTRRAAVPQLQGRTSEEVYQA